MQLRDLRNDGEIRERRETLVSGEASAVGCVLPAERVVHPRGGGGGCSWGREGGASEECRRFVSSMAFELTGGGRSRHHNRNDGEVRERREIPVSGFGFRMHRHFLFESSKPSYSTVW